MELALPPEWEVELPTDRPLTVDDYLRLPEGPPHFELIDGELVMNPTPVPLHVRVSTNLSFALMVACLPEMEIFSSPLDWVVDEHNVLEPDVSVCERAKVGEKRLYLPPLLCVEVLSPSTRRRDLGAKWDIYDRGGVVSYWIIDPQGPRLLVHELNLASGKYRIEADLFGEATFNAKLPFPVAIDVGALVL